MPKQAGKFAPRSALPRNQHLSGNEQPHPKTQSHRIHSRGMSAHPGRHGLNETGSKQDNLHYLTTLS